MLIYSCVCLSTQCTYFNTALCNEFIVFLQSWYALSPQAGLAIVDDEAEVIDIDEEIDREVAELTDMTKEDIEMLTMDEEEAEEEDARKALADNKDKILRGTAHLKLIMQYNINTGRKSRKTST